MDVTFYVMVNEGGGGGIRKKPSQATQKKRIYRLR